MPARPSVTMTLVRRFALAVIVAVLATSASGVWSLAVSEPCAANELAGTDEGACPPTCVTCGCCARAAEPVLLVLTSSVDAPATHATVLLSRLPKADPLDILHVPKLRLA